MSPDNGQKTPKKKSKIRLSGKAAMAVSALAAIFATAVFYYTVLCTRSPDGTVSVLIGFGIMTVIYSVLFIWTICRVRYNDRNRDDDSCGFICFERLDNR